MGLDISVYKITKKKTDFYFRLIDNNLNYQNNFPEWTKKYEVEVEEAFTDWDEYKERTGIDINDYHIVCITGGSDGYIEIVKNEKDGMLNEVKIPITDIKDKYIKIKVLYREEVGYQRKGLNGDFYKDYDDGKIGYFVWNKKELMRYKTDYAIDPDEFQENIIDNFSKNCVCTFDW